MKKQLAIISVVLEAIDVPLEMKTVYGLFRPTVLYSIPYYFKAEVGGRNRFASLSILVLLSLHQL